jgi:hypothetical protein
VGRLAIAALLAATVLLVGVPVIAGFSSDTSQTATTSPVTVQNQTVNVTIDLVLIKTGQVGITDTSSDRSAVR